MSSKSFSDQVAQGMSEILKNESFYKPFTKPAVKTASVEWSDFGLDELQDRFPEAFEALPEPYQADHGALSFFIDNNGNLCAEGDHVVGGEYTFLTDTKEWIRIASVNERAFEVFAAKKKVEKDEKADEKADKKLDKKTDKKSKKDEMSDEKLDEKADKKSKKEDKKDGKEKVEKEDKAEKAEKEEEPKGKKKQFPFWLKKKKAGKDCNDDCECQDCMEAKDEMYASAIRHIVNSFEKTSAALDNMGLEKSSIATMAILNHIIEEAKYVKMANESLPHLKEKLKDLKEKFYKMHMGNVKYNKDIAEELDSKITKLEDKVEKLKQDSNDVRGTDLLLGLDDPEAREGFAEEGMDDPKSTRTLEEIFTKNPKLVDDIAPKLKGQFHERAVEEQLKNRIKDRLPSIFEIPENDSFDEISKAYTARMPYAAKLPKEFRSDKDDLLKTEHDQLNASDGMDEDELVNKMVKELQKNFDEYDSSGEIDITHLAEETANKYSLLDGDDNEVPEYVFECAVEAAEKYESLKENDEEEEEVDFDDADDSILNACNLVDKWVKKAESDFEDEKDSKVTKDDLKSILDVIGGYSNKEIAEREALMTPADLDSYSKEYFDAIGKK